MKIDDKKEFLFRFQYEPTDSHWQHEGNGINWSHWIRINRPVPIPEFIKKQAKGQMKLYHNEIWERVEENDKNHRSFR